MVPLKGQCHEIVDFRFFSWFSFPQAPEYTTSVVSNFFENSRRYSQLEVHQWCPWHCTGGKWKKIFNLQNLPPSLIPVVHLDLRISPRIFEKIWNDPNVIFRGLGEDDSWKKLKAKNLVTCPFKKAGISDLNSVNVTLGVHCSWMHYSYFTIYNLGNDIKSFPRGFSLPRG